jgi:hypothetical protein
VWLSLAPVGIKSLGGQLHCGLSLASIGSDCFHFHEVEKRLIFNEVEMTLLVVCRSARSKASALLLLSKLICLSIPITLAMAFTRERYSI